MVHKRALRAIPLLLLTALACNLPRPVPETSPASTVGLALNGGAAPSGLPVLTLESGSGYLFETQEVVRGSDARDVWWNGVGFVPGSLMGSLGVLEDPQAVERASRSILKFEQFTPQAGETYLVEVASVGGYVLIRYLSMGDQGEITFEFLYPFSGEIAP